MAAGEVVIGSLSVLIGADASSLTKEARSAEERLRALEKTTSNTVNRIKHTMLALAGPTALGLLTKASIDAVSEQKDLAERLNSTVEGVQVMQRAAQLAGLSLEEMNKAADRLQRKLGEASRDAKGEAADAFRRLGLSAKDFAGQNLDERFEMIMKRIKELGLTTTETADLIGKLGIRGGKLGTLFAEGAENIDEARKQLKAFGVIVTDETAAKIEAAGDAMSVFGLAATGVGHSLAAELSPFIIQAAKDFQKLAEESGGVGNATRRAVDGGIEIVAAFMNVGDQLKVEFDEWAKTATEAVNGIIRAMNKVADIPGVRLLGGKLIEEVAWTGIEFDKHAASLTMSKEELEKKLGRPLSGDAFKAWVESARKAAEDAAQIAADAKQDRAQDDEEFGFGKPGLGTKEREAQEKKLLSFRASLASEAEAANIHRQQQLDQAKEFYEKGIVDQTKYAELRASIDQKFREDNQKKIWDNFQSVGATELEVLAHQNSEKLKLLQEYEAARTITEEEAAKLRQQINEDYEMKKLQTIAQGYSGLAGIVDTAMGSINQIMGDEGKKGFGIMKAISMATALVKGFEATVSAYAAGSKIGGPPLGFAMAAVAAAGTAAIIAKLAATNPGSGGSTAGAAGAGGGAVSAQAPTSPSNEGVAPERTLLVQGFNRKEFFSGDMVRDIAANLLEFQRDGGRVILETDS